LNIQVCHVLKGRQKTAGGFTFKYKYNDWYFTYFRSQDKAIHRFK
jgi:TPP-dependent pyruvate/acetoin dehydrogenase alpha subunit